MERKKYSTKEGSANEDLGLVLALHEVMCQTDQMTPQITSLATMLVTFGLDEKAHYLQSSFSSLLSLFTKHEQEIWPTAVGGSEENEPEFGPQLTTDGAVSLLRGNGNEGDVSLITQRMKNLQAHMQHAPLPSRSKHWDLHMLRKDT